MKRTRASVVVVVGTYFTLHSARLMRSKVVATWCFAPLPWCAALSPTRQWAMTPRGKTARNKTCVNLQVTCIRAANVHASEIAFDDFYGCTCHIWHILHVQHSFHKNFTTCVIYCNEDSGKRDIGTDIAHCTPDSNRCIFPRLLRLDSHSSGILCSDTCPSNQTLDTSRWDRHHHTLPLFACIYDIVRCTLDKYDCRSCDKNDSKTRVANRDCWSSCQAHTTRLKAEASAFSARSFARPVPPFSSPAPPSRWFYLVVSAKPPIFDLCLFPSLAIKLANVLHTSLARLFAHIPKHIEILHTKRWRRPPPSISSNVQSLSKIRSDNRCYNWEI